MHRIECLTEVVNEYIREMISTDASVMWTTSDVWMTDFTLVKNPIMQKRGGMDYITLTDMEGRYGLLYPNMHETRYYYINVHHCLFIIGCGVRV